MSWVDIKVKTCLSYVIRSRPVEVLINLISSAEERVPGTRLSLMASEHEVVPPHAQSYS